MLEYVSLWFPLVLIAVANGVLRQAWYGRCLGELAAPQPTNFLLPRSTFEAG